MSAPAAVAGVARVRSSRGVALLDADRGLRDVIPPDELAFAQRLVLARRHDIEPGFWSPQTLIDDGDSPVAALVIGGLVTREVTLAGRSSATLFGPGDCFCPWRTIDTSLRCVSEWESSGASIAVLGHHFRVAARRWPALAALIDERLAEQHDLAVLRTAIVSLPRVEQRVIAVFWQLADRWGVVSPVGIVVRLPLTHALLGHLVGAQRPTVTLALAGLAEQGLLRRGESRAWILSHDSADILDDGAHDGARISTAGGPPRPPHQRPHPADLVHRAQRMQPQ